MLQLSVVRPNGDETDAVEIALAPVPVVEGFEVGQRGAHEVEIVLALVDAFDAPGEQRGLRV